MGAITWVIKREENTMNSHTLLPARVSMSSAVAYFRVAVFWLLMTFFTIFASSTRKARRILGRRVVRYGTKGRLKKVYRDFTQSPHREPPYARRTVFIRFETVAYWRGRSAGIYEPVSSSNTQHGKTLSIHQVIRSRSHRIWVE